MSSHANIALKLPELAAQTPDQVAVSAPQGGPKNGKFIYKSLTFSELEELSNLYAYKLKESGLNPGDKVLMFVRPSLDFSALTFALFKAGLVPIFIDPGMGRKNLLKAIGQIQPKGLIAEPEVHILRLLFRKPFRSIKTFITTKGLAWGQLSSVKRWKENPQSVAPIMFQADPLDPAAILFTSGGTGAPKGVLYTHKIFNAQVKRLKEMFNLRAGDVDCPGFPLFSLFTITMGMKSAIPAMNPSKPKEANPEWLVKNINDHQASFVAGSPAIWENVADYCLKNSITLPSVKSLVMFGAPVSLKLHQKFSQILTNGDTYTPYGATECLPVANISGEELATEISEKMRQGKGTCVGHAAPETIIKIAPITDEPIDKEKDFSWLPQGELGEICVYSDTVTPEYVGMPEKTREAKIKANEGGLWHRMGDLGYIDDRGRLWFCGRKAHRIEWQGQTLPSVPSEAIYNEIPGIKRVAFIGPKLSGQTCPSYVVELEEKGSPSAQSKKEIEKAIFELAKKNFQQVPISKVYFHQPFPVDVRHNIKIDRKALCLMVEKGRIR